jgi:putative PEP-CTERM system histidine kinase
MIFMVCYGLGAAGFLTLIALTLINRSPRGIGIGVVITCVVTAIWALLAAAEPWSPPGVTHAVESIRSGAWLILMASILAVTGKKDSPGAGWFGLPAAAIVIALVSFGNDCRFLFSATGPTTFFASQVMDRVLVAVCGILVVENLYRNTSPGRRWNVKPLCIAVGAMFAYDLYVFCEAVILKGVSPSLLAGRGIVLALITPLLILSMARNPGWDIDIHVSRRVVFHGATLSGAGIFLLIAAGVASLIGRLPGEWAGISEIGFLCGSIILLLVVLSTESFRSRLRRLIAENFFSTRYDYRAEWLRTVATLSSSEAGEPLGARAIRAVADVVDSPGGALWLEDSSGDYRIVQILAATIDSDAVETGSGIFVGGFRGGDWVQTFSDAAAPRPAWAAGCWLAVPLIRVDRLIGFVVLAPPRAPAALNWESFDLLLAIGQQVAAYLEEERAIRTLLESEALIEYSRKFSFVIHDIKNVSGQLGLMVANMTRFGERAEFRADMVRGMEGCVEKLRNLTDRLRPDRLPVDGAKNMDPATVVLEVVRELDSSAHPVRARIDTNDSCVYMVPSDLHAILTHLVTNALEASEGGDEVLVGLKCEREKVTVDVIDKGKGMSPEFVRNSLFIPMRSTKELGHGIGAYQARHLARAAGGDLEVISAVGRGTIMRVVLPRIDRIQNPLPELAAT